MVKKPSASVYKTKRPNSLAARRQRRQLVIGILILVIFAASVFCLSWFLSQPFITINNVTVSGNSLVKAEEIMAAAKGVIADSYLGLFSKSNIFLYPEKVIDRTLAAAFPAIKSVHGNLENWQTLHLSVEERVAFALWCPTINSEDCFYLDENGLIFAKAPVFSDSIFIKFSGEISSDTSPIGKNFISVDEFRRINFFLNSLATLGLMPTSFEANADNYQIFIKNNGRLIVGASDDLSLTLENLGTILRSDNLKKALAQGDVIDYIDLRYGHKVFYKLKTDN